MAAETYLYLLLLLEPLLLEQLVDVEASSGR